MEENSREGIFRNKGISPKEEKNVVNLRQRAAAAEEPTAEMAAPVEKLSPAPARDLLEAPRGGLLERIVEFGVYALVFLMPVFILPFSFEYFEFNKSLLLVAGSVFLALLALLDGIFLKRRLALPRTRLTAAFALFLGVLLASAWFSVDRNASFLGYGTNYSDSFFFYLGLFLFYLLFLGRCAVRGTEQVLRRASRALVLGALVVSLVSLPYYFGLDQVPGFGAAAAGFNLASLYPQVFAIYLVSMLFVVIFKLTAYCQEGVLGKSVCITTAILLLFNLIMVDWALAYLVLFALCGLLLLLGGKLNREGIAHSERLLLGLMVFSALFFLSCLDLNGIMSGRVNLGTSAITSALRAATGVEMYSSSGSGFSSGEALNIARASFADRPVLGSGVGTYQYDFFKFKSAAFNTDVNWYVGLNKAFNEMLEKVSTIGLLGTLSYLLLLGLGLWLLVRQAERREHAQYLLAGFLALLVFQFLFLDTALLKFLLVLLLAIAAAEDAEARAALKVYAVDRKKLSGVLLSLGGVVASLGCLLMLIFAVQIYRADMQYRQVKAADVKTLDANLALGVLTLNPYKADYAAGISGVYLSRLLVALASAGNEQTAGSQALLNEANSSLAYAQQAVLQSPRNFNFWVNYGYIYKTIGDYGTTEHYNQAITQYKQALELAPNDPVIATEIGKIYLIEYEKALEAKDTGAQRETLKQAKLYLEQALKLKSDYPAAALAAALVYRYEGDGAKSLLAVDAASRMSGLTADEIVEIGRIYYNAGDREKAKNALNYLVSYDEKNADARYILGAIYRDEKKYPEALTQFNLVAQENPNNTGLKEAIAELQTLLKGNTSSTPTEASGEEGDEADE